jgi:periplasmic protein TonB
LVAALSLVVVAASPPAAAGPPQQAMGPRPAYPSDMKNHHIGGSGVFLLHVDVKTGKVRDVTVEKSTGHSELDTSAVAALRRWTFVPNTVADKVRIPITFSPSSGVKMQ